MKPLTRQRLKLALALYRPPNIPPAQGGTKPSSRKAGTQAVPAKSLR